MIKALQAEPRPDAWWIERHEQKLDRKKALDKLDLLLVGDSITHGWEDHQQVWNQHFGQLTVLNLGFSGDRTEHVLWRLHNGAVDGLAPRVVVLMIGTNNTGHRQDPATETAEGISAIVEELRERLPQAQVLLLAIFPRGKTADDPLRELNTAINRRIATLADGQRIRFVDLQDAFLAEEGNLRLEVMPDLLHPNGQGYRLWAAAMKPHIDALLTE